MTKDEAKRLYQCLNEESKEKVNYLIETLLNQQSDDPQSPDLRA